MEVSPHRIVLLWLYLTTFHEAGRALGEAAQGGPGGISRLLSGDIPNPPGRVPESLALGDPALAMDGAGSFPEVPSNLNDSVIYFWQE